ncbi:hypothetical protein llap_227 [Limosa lapponica baueri]|uniref:Uncharacterized protein n=1 Tax=Limosa lapponica baueri TaxID=1758121 RepID=A0A2I0UU24_LIMLA|nr:hypothetical protein llap_227 [Limosa lapponica baueri]
MLAMAETVTITIFAAHTDAFRDVDLQCPGMTLLKGCDQTFIDKLRCFIQDLNNMVVYIRSRDRAQNPGDPPVAALSSSPFHKELKPGHAEQLNVWRGAELWKSRFLHVTSLVLTFPGTTSALSADSANVLKGTSGKRSRNPQYGEYSNFYFYFHGKIQTTDKSLIKMKLRKEGLDYKITKW